MADKKIDDLLPFPNIDLAAIVHSPEVQHMLANPYKPDYSEWAKHVLANPEPLEPIRLTRRAQVHNMMKELSWTQTSIAERTHISRRTISEWFNREKDIPQWAFDAIKAYYIITKHGLIKEFNKEVV